MNHYSTLRPSFVPGNSNLIKFGPGFCSICIVKSSSKNGQKSFILQFSHGIHTVLSGPGIIPESTRQSILKSWSCPAVPLKTTFGSLQINISLLTVNDCDGSGNSIQSIDAGFTSVFNTHCKVWLVTTSLMLLTVTLRQRKMIIQNKIRILHL